MNNVTKLGVSDAFQHGLGIFSHVNEVATYRIVFLLGLLVILGSHERVSLLLRLQRTLEAFIYTREQRSAETIAFVTISVPRGTHTELSQKTSKLTKSRRWVLLVHLLLLFVLLLSGLCELRLGREARKWFLFESHQTFTFMSQLAMSEFEALGSHLEADKLNLEIQRLVRLNLLRVK